MTVLSPQIEASTSLGKRLGLVPRAARGLGNLPPLLRKFGGGPWVFRWKLRKKQLARAFSQNTGVAAPENAERNIFKCESETAEIKSKNNDVMVW